MKISASDKKKAAFEKRYWKLTREILAKSRQPVVDKAAYVDPDRLKNYVRGLLLTDIVRDHISDIWSKAGGTAMYDVGKQIEKATGKIGKTIKGAGILMRNYVNERSQKLAAQKANKVMGSQTEAINQVIDTVLEKQKVEGLGILETRKIMVHELESGRLVEIENWQARRIAMTEVGEAQNTATWLEGKNQNLLKRWVHVDVSRFPRQNHIEYGQMEPREEEYEYTDGLKYPHDENAEAEEVINCYCSMYWLTKD